MKLVPEGGLEGCGCPSGNGAQKCQVIFWNPSVFAGFGGNAVFHRCRLRCKKFVDFSLEAEEWWFDWWFPSVSLVLSEPVLSVVVWILVTGAKQMNPLWRWL